MESTYQIARQALELAKSFGGRRTKDLDILHQAHNRLPPRMQQTETVLAAGKYRDGANKSLGGMLQSGQRHIETRAKRRGIQQGLQVTHQAGKAVRRFAKRAAVGGLVVGGALATASALRRRKRQAQELSLALPGLGKLAELGRIGARKVGRFAKDFGMQVKRKAQAVTNPDAIQRVRGASLARKANQAATVAKQKAEFAATQARKPRGVLGRVGQFARGAGRATIGTAKAAFNPKNIGHAAIAATGIGIGATMARRSETDPLKHPEANRKGWRTGVQ